MADPGRLKELLLPERRVWLRPAFKPERKTEWTAVLVESPGGEGLVSLDTTLPNRLIGAALKNGAMEEFRGWAYERAEFRMRRSRLDFLLSHRDGRRLALEVKSVTLVEDGVALFPDALTERGARHIRELAEISGREGWEAAVLFVLQRSDASEIRAARSVDPRFAEALEEARIAGVRAMGRRCLVCLDRMELGSPVPVGVDP
jgi:sugar fermentation stimulation protein A